MSNYNLVINSQFQPFSYQEMLDPVLRATQAHQDIENQYSELATKANIWENMANEQTDHNAYTMYKNYSNSLKAQADDLAKNGLTPLSRASLMNMKSDYSKYIIPIEQAFTKRAKEAEEQRKANAVNPYIRPSRDASTTSLDDYIDNPSLSYTSIDGKQIMSQTASMAAAFAKDLTEHPDKLKEIFPFQYEGKFKNGASYQDVLAAINDGMASGNPSIVKALQSMRDIAVKSSGISNFSEARQQELMPFVNSMANAGLFQGIGTTQYKDYEDRYNMQSALAAQQHQYRLDEQKQAAQLSNQNTFSGKDANPMNLYTPAEVKELDAAANKYKQYFTKGANGHYYINNAGIKLYNAKQTQYNGVLYGGNVVPVKQPNLFKQYIDSIGAGKFMKANKNGRIAGPGRVGLLFEQSINRGRLNANRDIAYRVGIANRKDFADTYIGAYHGSGDIPTMEYVNENGKRYFKQTGTISRDKLDGATFTTHIIGGKKHGDAIEVKLKDNTSIYLPVNRAMNIFNYNRADSYADTANDLLSKFKNKNLTPKQKEYLYNAIKINQMYINQQAATVNPESGMKTINYDNTVSGNLDYSDDSDLNNEDSSQNN